MHPTVIILPKGTIAVVEKTKDFASVNFYSAEGTWLGGWHGAIEHLEAEIEAGKML